MTRCSSSCPWVGHLVEFIFLSVARCNFAALPPSSRPVTVVSSTVPTVSSRLSRASTRRPTPPGRYPRLTSPARGCRASRARASTLPACPWASTTRWVASGARLMRDATVWYVLNHPDLFFLPPPTRPLAARVIQRSKHQLLRWWILVRPRQRGRSDPHPNLHPPPTTHLCSI